MEYIILVAVLLYILAYAGTQRAPTINQIAAQRGDPPPLTASQDADHQHGCGSLIAGIIVVLVLILLFA